MNQEELLVQEKETKKKQPTIVFGVLSIIFSHISNYTLIGLVFGIIGIVKALKNPDNSKNSLSLSIIGTSLSGYSIVASIYSTIMFTIIYCFIFLIGIMAMISAMISGVTSGAGSYY